VSEMWKSVIGFIINTSGLFLMTYGSLQYYWNTTSSWWLMSFTMLAFVLIVDKLVNCCQTVQSELQGLDEEILKQFPPKLKLIRAITPRRTKHGTLNKSDFRFVKDGDLSEYSGDPFSLCSWVPFNPSSHKQLIGVLSAAGWSPTDRTQTHVDTERELQRLRYSKNRDKSVDLQQTECIIVIRIKEEWLEDQRTKLKYIT